MTDIVVDEVLFALPNNYAGVVEKHITLCEERDLTVKIALDLYNLNVAKTYVHSIGAIPVLTYHTVSLNDRQHFLKRCADVFQEGGSIVLTVKGGSMMPFLRPFKDRVILLAACFSDLRRGDIVLVRRSDASCVLYRVMRVDGNSFFKWETRRPIRKKAFGKRISLRG